jgi:hypothetical protein
MALASSTTATMTIQGRSESLPDNSFPVCAELWESCASHAVVSARRFMVDPTDTWLTLGARISTTMKQQPRVGDWKGR